jgi:uncharacterized membrane protein
MLLVLKICVACFYLLFLPGYILSYVLFQKNEIGIFERVAISLATSMSIVPLVVFYGSRIGIPVSTLSVGVEVGSIIGLAYAYTWYRNIDIW